MYTLEDILQNVMMGNLLAIYGRLLTDRQYRLLDLYFNQDYSLAEIAEQENISRQAVHDSLQRGEKSINNWENELHILQNQNQRQEAIQLVMQIMQGWSLSAKEDAERSDILRVLQAIIEGSEEEVDGI